MREVQASCSSDLDLGQAGRAREGGGGSLCFFLFPLPIVPVVSLLNGMGAAATVNIYLGNLLLRKWSLEFVAQPKVEME